MLGIIKSTQAYHSIGTLILRVSVPGMMLTHGWSKLQAYGERAESFPDPFGVGPAASMALAIFSEFFCALAVMLGLWTRLSLIPLIITMVVAAFVIHGADPFQKKELALMYLVVFLGLFFSGPGPFSLDAMIRKLKA